MPYVTVDKENSADVKLYYEDHGSGKPVVLIHGFPLNGEAWEKQKIALTRAGYRTITYDRRGFGISDKPAFGYDYDTFAADLDKLMTKLDIRDAMLVGHSMGTGEVTRYLAKYGSGRVSRAVFISALQPFLLKTDDNPAGVDKKFFDQIQEAIMEDRYSYMTQFLDDFYNVDELLGNRLSRDALQASWNTASLSSPRGAHDSVASWYTDFREDIKKITVPSLIIHGDADRVLPIDATSRLFHKLLPGSRLVVVQGGPHGIAWTHAEEVNSAMMAFLEKQPTTEDARESQRMVRRGEQAFGEKIDDEYDAPE